MFIEREVKAFTRGRPGESLGAAKKHHKLAKKKRDTEKDDVLI